VAINKFKFVVDAALKPLHDVIDLSMCFLVMFVYMVLFSFWLCVFLSPIYFVWKYLCQ